MCFDKIEKTLVTIILAIVEIVVLKNCQCDFYFNKNFTKASDHHFELDVFL